MTRCWNESEGSRLPARPLRVNCKSRCHFSRRCHSLSLSAPRPIMCCLVIYLVASFRLPSHCSGIPLIHTPLYSTPPPYTSSPSLSHRPRLSQRSISPPSLRHIRSPVRHTRSSIMKPLPQKSHAKCSLWDRRRTPVTNERAGSEPNKRHV